MSTMEEGNPATGLLIIFIILLFKALVTAINVALHNVNDNSIKKKLEKGNKKAEKLMKIRQSSESYFIGMELVLNFTSIFVGMLWVIEIGNLIEARPVFYVLTTVLLIFIATLFGSLIPKKVATRHANDICIKAISILNSINMIFKPLSWTLEKVMNLIFIIFRINPSNMMDNVTEEEIIHLINEGHEQGIFNAGEADMISNIIELDEKEAEDIMTNKKNIVAVSADMSVEEAIYFMLEGSYSRYPLYEEDRDNIIGVLHLKDVISAYISDELKDKSLKEIAREPYFVPNTQSINILFHRMQNNKIHMAIVIDEYGQTAGLVAMEDFLEEIVGNIEDEYDEEESKILSIDDSGWIVRGSISLEELEDELHIVLEHDYFDTLNGLLISLLDRIPADGEKAQLEYGEYRFDILETLNRMIQKVRISKK